MSLLSLLLYLRTSRFFFSSKVELARSLSFEVDLFLADLEREDFHEEFHGKISLSGIPLVNFFLDALFDLLFFLFRQSFIKLFS